MALAYKGVYVSENQIMGYLNVDSAPRQDNIWGTLIKVMWEILMENKM